MTSDNGMLRRDIDKQMAECYELRKENEYQGSRNNDASAQIRDNEMRLRDRDDQLYAMQKELESSKFTNQQSRGNNLDLLAEKDALEKHAAVLNAQNEDLNRELDQFLQTDEMVRSQLDRRGRVQGLRSKNDTELHRSYHRVEDARSRSPQRRF